MMNVNEKSGRTELPDDDYVVFIPDEDMRAIERTIRNMEQIRRERCRIKDNRKPLNSGEQKIES
jgi:hypothetical protein